MNDCPYKDKSGKCMAKPEEEGVIHRFLRDQRLIRPNKGEEPQEDQKKRRSLSDYFGGILGR